MADEEKILEDYTKAQHREPWFHWFTVNDNEDKHGRTGSILRQGRLCLYFGRTCVRLEWNLWSTFAHAAFDWGGDGDDFGFSLALPPIALWLHFERILPRKWKSWNKRELGFSIHHWGLWLKLWADPWSGKTPRWREPHFNLNPIDYLLGQPRYSDETLQEVRVEVPMPEGVYPATVRVFESRWKRPRWPWPKRMVRTDITPDTPIPFPGKGENSWDQGEDAVHSMTSPADTPIGAVASLVESVMLDRERNGGTNWRPAERRVG